MVVDMHPGSARAGDIIGAGMQDAFKREYGSARYRHLCRSFGICKTIEAGRSFFIQLF